MEKKTRYRRPPAGTQLSVNNAYNATAFYTDLPRGRYAVTDRGLTNGSVVFTTGLDRVWCNGRMLYVVAADGRTGWVYVNHLVGLAVNG